MVSGLFATRLWTWYVETHSVRQTIPSSKKGLRSRFGTNEMTDVTHLSTGLQFIIMRDVQLNGGVSCYDVFRE